MIRVIPIALCASLCACAPNAPNPVAVGVGYFICTEADRWASSIEQPTLRQRAEIAAIKGLCADPSATISQITALYNRARGKVTKP